MDKKRLIDLGFTVLAVVVGIGVYNTITPMIRKARVSEPSGK